MGKPIKLFSLDDYLAWEEMQPERHEYHDGEIYRMVGARRVHNLCVLNIYSALRSRLRDTAYQAFVETAKLQIGSDTILYPDILVTCDPSDLSTERIFNAPTLIVEVLSPRTQRYNRGKKFTLYRRIPSLREYLLIDPDTREVQVNRRTDEGLFAVHDHTEEPFIRLESLGLDLPAAEVFERLPDPVSDAPQPDDA